MQLKSTNNEDIHPIENGDAPSGASLEGHLWACGFRAFLQIDSYCLGACARVANLQSEKNRFSFRMKTQPVGNSLSDSKGSSSGICEC